MFGGYYMENRSGLVVIPARGGSKGIPKKNIRLLINRPLISYVIQTAIKSKFQLDVVVTTDSEEIAYISEYYGSEVLIRPNNLANDEITLDPVVYHAVNSFETKHKKKYDYVITIQPTSPLLKTNTLDLAIQQFLELNYDTVISCVDNPHLSWFEFNGRIVPNYKERTNRQNLPKNYIETGSFVITKRQFISSNNRFGNNICVFEVPKDESIDIDNVEDWWIVEKTMKRKNIIIRVDGYSEIGLGHIYRGIILAHLLIDHKVTFVLTSKSKIGIQKIKESFYLYEVFKNETEFIDYLKKTPCDILINDILDTSIDYMSKLRELNIRIINFEDLGNGSKLAHSVINDLYEKKNNESHYYWGNKYFLLRDEFIYENKITFNEHVKNILIVFGGTDPLNLTKRLLNIILKMPKNINYIFVLGMGYKYADEILETCKQSNNVVIYRNISSMAKIMSKVDFAISSQGRTMLELASLNIPTILLAQNERELHHELGKQSKGFKNLGLGSKVEDQTIYETIIQLINDTKTRKQMYNNMKENGFTKGNERVLKIILGE